MEIFQFLAPQSKTKESLNYATNFLALLIFYKAYPQSYKDTVRISDADSARSYNSTTPLLVPTARICCSEATEAHTASPEPNSFSALIDSACFTPFLLTEHDNSCPPEYNTNSNLNGRLSSNWIMADFLEILFSEIITLEAPPKAQPLSRDFGS
jgi:hypothetical protein